MTLSFSHQFLPKTGIVLLIFVHSPSRHKFLRRISTVDKMAAVQTKSVVSVCPHHHWLNMVSGETKTTARDTRSRTLIRINMNQTQMFVIC